MALIQWTEKLSVGVRQFDDDHRKIVQLLNGLFEDTRAGRGKEVVGLILDELITYTRSHFAAEEKCLEDFGYHQLAQHRKEHQALIIQVLQLREDYLAGVRTDIGIDIAHFLKTWLVEHILGSDRAYSGYLTNIEGHQSKAP